MSQNVQQKDPELILGGRYKIISHLAAGGFGQTFLAEDTHLPGYPQCVVKKLKPKMSDTDTLSMARRFFDTEAKVLYQLNHDQIPNLLAHFEDNEEFYLVQELIEGEPLSKELTTGEPWSEEQVIALLQDILQVLAFVHQQQVIHRDIKPPNLMRRKSDGRIVIIDFGAVKQVSSHFVDSQTGQTNLTISIGTKGYMPNEQLAGNPRFCSDVYAVGMVGIQALTGRHPKRLSEDPKTGEIDWQQHVVQVSPELAAILDQMIRYDFRDRYPTATEALEALCSLSAASTEFKPLPQQLSEKVETSPNLKLESLSTVIESTESEPEEPSTHIWIPKRSTLKSSTLPNSTDQTEPLESSVYLQPSGNSAPVPTSLEKLQKQLVKFWSIPAILTAVGATFVITKTALSPQLTNSIQSINSGVTATSPIASPVKSPIPTPSPLTPEQQAAEFLKQADSLRKAGKYSEALKVYDQAIDLKPNVAQAYWGRCDSLNKLKKPAEAVVACNDALDLKPRYAEAFWGKGVAYDQQKQPLEALQLYERATKTKSDFLAAWVSYGVALQGFGRSEEAIIALNKAIALKRDSAQAWATKGEAQWNLGRFNQAIASLDKALEIQPNYPKAQELRKKVQKELDRDK